MKIKVSDATNTQLDWLVAKARGFDIYHDALLNGHVRRGFWVSGYFPGDPNSWMLLSQIATSTNWAQGGPIIESENITIIRCEAEYGTDRKGFTTSKRISVWAATAGQHRYENIYGSQGDHWGTSYCIDTDGVVYGPTPLIAAMRCFVLSKLGNVIEVPRELL